MNFIKYKNHPNRKLNSELKEYGGKNFIIEVLLYCEDQYKNYYEKKIIDFYDHKTLYNRRIINVNKNIGVFYTKESKEKLSNALKGNKNPNYGKHWSKEIIRKQSLAKLGDKNPNYGKHISDEQREKVRKTWSKKPTSFYASYCISKESVLEIKKCLQEGNTIKSTSIKTGFCREAVGKVKNGWYKKYYEGI